MSLTKKTLEAIDNVPTRMRIALALDCSEMTIKRYIKNNDDDLTKAAALEVIRKETGFTDAEILEPQPALTH